jgi:hypothetical protein
VEAMMERYAQWRQLDLLMLDKSATQRQLLEPLNRSEIANLLKLLLNECVAGAATVKEPDNE